MTVTDIAPRNGSADAAVIMERVLLAGDLERLSPAERVTYYQRTCNSLGLNPLTQPFQYIKLNGKLTLYASRGATDQLRNLHGVSIDPPQSQIINDTYVVTVTARDKSGRTDSDIGAVSIKGLMGEALSNAMMKGITKAKRRVTLSICGLGWMDESETSSIPGAQTVAVDLDTGEILEPAPVQAQQRQAPVINNASSVRVQPDPEPDDDEGSDLHEAWQEWERLKNTAKTVGASVGAEPPRHATLTQINQYVTAIGKRIGAAQAEAPF